MAKGRTYEIKPEQVESINKKIDNLKSQIKPNSSTLFVKNINDKIKKLEDKLKESKAPKATPQKPNVFREAPKKNPMLRDVSIKNYKGKTDNTPKSTPRRAVLKDKLKGSSRFGVKTRAKGTILGDFKRKQIK